MAHEDQNPLPNLLGLGALSVAMTAGCFAAFGLLALPSVTEWDQPTTWRSLFVIEGFIWLLPTLCVIVAGVSGVGVVGLGRLLWFRKPAAWLTLLAVISIPLIGIGLAYHATASAIGPGFARFAIPIVAALGGAISAPISQLVTRAITRVLVRVASNRYHKRVTEPLAMVVADANAIPSETPVHDQRSETLTESGRIVAAAVRSSVPFVAFLSAHGPVISLRRDLRAVADQLDESLAQDRSVGEVKDALGATQDSLTAIMGVSSPSLETDSLNEAVRLNRDKTRDREDEVILAVSDLTFDSVSSAIELAERKHAISEQFRTRASVDLVGMRIYWSRVFMHDRGVDPQPLISVVPWFPDARNVGSVTWQPGTTMDAVMAGIVQRLEVANLDATVDVFDPNLTVRNLQDGLRMAMASQRGDLVRRLEGPLIELIDDHWALTDAGVESREHGVIVWSAAFPRTIRQFQDPGTPPFTPPPPPKDVDPDFWERLMELSRVTYLLLGAAPRRKGFV